MAMLKVSLFGRFHIQHQEQLLNGFEAAKVQELFCYLLLNRDRPQPRETLAALLWGDNPSAQARKYLRQALWQMQAALEPPDAPGATPVLQVGADWVELKSVADLWLDVATFEQAYKSAQGVHDAELSQEQVKLLQNAVRLYTGNLLEGWYQDWCLYERERLQNLQLAMLDKLMRYCEAHQAYEAGLDYGAEILRFDRARECTHRRLMRLHYLAGDRTGGLRQYQRCVAALNEELGVPPAHDTVALYEQIRTDHLADTVAPHSPASAAPSTISALRELLGRLQEIQELLGEGHGQLCREIERLERKLGL